MTRPVKRSFSIRGHKTSISLEAPFWEALKEAAEREGVSLASLITEIDAGRNQDSGLSTAVRIWILHYWRRTEASRSYDGGNRD